MKITLLIAENKGKNDSCILRGKKGLIMKILRHNFTLTKEETKMILSGTPVIRSDKKYKAHVNYNSLHEDIECLKKIHALLSDIEKNQPGEYIRLLRDTVIYICKNIKNIEMNFQSNFFIE